MALSALIQNTERLLVLLASQSKKHRRKAHPTGLPLTEVTAPRLYHMVASATVVTALKWYESLFLPQFHILPAARLDICLVQTAWV